jgi:hypothetical protein
MNIKLNISIILTGLFLILLIVNFVRKEKIPIKYALIWLLSGIIIVLIGLVPGFFFKISSFIGFKEMSNMVIAVFIFLIVLINIVLAVILSNQNKKIINLTQEVSLLKSKK